MLLCDLGPLSVKFACIFIDKDDKAMDLFIKNRSELKYFELQNSLNHENISLNFMKLNYIKEKDFHNSLDYKIILQFISEEKISNLYFCGNLNEKKNLFLTNLFNIKLVKISNTTHLTIRGIYFLTDFIDKKTMFDLSNQDMKNLFRVAQINAINSKNYISYKNNLFPFLLTNAIEGVSCYLVTSPNDFKRIGGNNK